MPLQPRRKTANERYGRSVRTIERWEEDEELKFPKSIIIKGRKYDDTEKLDAWDAACAARTRDTARPPAAGKPTDNREVKPGTGSQSAATGKSAQPAETESLPPATFVPPRRARRSSITP